MSWKRRLQLAAVAVALVTYSLLSHYSNSHAQARDLATALALAPILILGAVLLWRGLGLIVCVLGVGVAFYLLKDDWPLFRQNFGLLYFAQQFGFYGLMTFSFGITLVKPRVPLCTLLADRVHGPLSPAELRYTRKVTVAWTLFFVANMVTTLLLFEFASIKAWSFFVNFLSLPLVAIMFAGEYVVRRRVLPQVKSGGLLATLKVYFG